MSCKLRVIIGLLWMAAGLCAAEYMPVLNPETPSTRLRVCGQNLQNYYIHYDNYQSTRANYNHAFFANKTRKIVDAFLLMDADIYAVCEVEACALVLEQLADSLNKYAGEARYKAVADGINEAWSKQYDNNLKSGFIYRTDRVKPYQSNTAASTWNYYKNTMRIQAFEELATGERLVVSMNHFKAKTGDGGDEIRLSNAESLVSALKKSLGDPDILVLGDMNCEMGESPLVKIVNAGYTEQLLRYESDAYSYCYNGEGSLIDHAFANTSMSKQIVDAGMYHICTTRCGINNYATSYSDHDPYVVDICLGKNGKCRAEGLEEVPESDAPVRKILINGHLYIVLSGGEIYDITGRKVQ